MDLIEAIRSRRSIRKFKNRPVPKEVLQRILDHAVWAPSGMNRQEWYFIVVQGPKKEELLKIFSAVFEIVKPHLEKVFAGKPKIIEGMWEFVHTFAGAPVFVLAYAGKGPSGQWDMHSTACAIQNLLLATHMEGLGTVWTDGVLAKENEINTLMGIQDKKLVAVLPFGYPDEIPRIPPRREGRVAWIGF
jgi:nitroreductase